MLPILVRGGRIVVELVVLNVGKPNAEAACVAGMGVVLVSGVTTATTSAVDLLL